MNNYYHVRLRPASLVSRKTTGRRVFLWRPLSVGVKLYRLQRRRRGAHETAGDGTPASKSQGIGTPDTGGFRQFLDRSV